MKLDKNTFCVAPWFQIRQNIDGTFKSCCAIRHDQSEFDGQKKFLSLQDWLASDYLKYLKQNLTSGNFLPECSACWNKENAGLKSVRNFLNDTITENRPLDQSWIQFYFKNKKDFEHDLLVSADIKTSNVCNFSCAMCIPNDSSKIHAVWKKSQNHPLVQEVISHHQNYFEEIDLIYRDGKSYQLLKEVLENKPKNLKLLGGEPLLDSVLLQILDDYNHKSFTNLIFITNGSVDLTKVCVRLKEFKSVNFVISLEGIGDVQDYIRKGSNWKYIESNIESYISIFGTENLSVTHTLQCLTLLHLPDLVEWTYKKNISLAVSMLVNPDYLSLNVIPPELFRSVSNVFKQQEFTIQSSNQEEMIETVTLSKLAKLFEKNYKHNSELVSKLKMFVDWYDPDQKWKHILPEWLPYLD